MKPRRIKGDGLSLATALYGPPKVDRKGQTSLDLNAPKRPIEEKKKDDPLG